MQTHLYEMYKYVFYVCAIWYTQAFSLKNYCGFNTKSYCSDVCGYHQCPQTLVEICRNMGICFSFRAVAAREKYPGFMLSGNPLVSLTWAPPMSKMLTGCQSASLDWSCPGLKVTKQICSIPLFSFFSESPKHWLPVEQHIYIWLVLPDLSSGDTCQSDWNSLLYTIVKPNLSLWEKLIVLFHSIFPLAVSSPNTVN